MTPPPPALAERLAVLCGAERYDAERDLRAGFIAGVSSADFTTLDLLHAWLGAPIFRAMLEQHASAISQDGLRLAVLRFDLPQGLIPLGLPPPPPSDAADDENDGLRHLQPVAPA